MGKWRSFLDSLATTGGHIFVLLCLVAMGIVFFHYDNTAGGQIIVGALGALYMMLKPSGTNAEQVARAGVPYQPPQPPADALKPPIVVGAEPLPPSEPQGDPK